MRFFPFMSWLPVHSLLTHASSYPTGRGTLPSTTLPEASMPSAAANKVPAPLRPKVLSVEEAVVASRSRLPATAYTFLAFYSSVLGGIVTDPSLMQIPMDEHMVHRGHAGTYSDPVA